MTARFGRGGFLQGGVSTGTTATNNCYQNDLPNITAQGSLASTPRSPESCDVSTPWSGDTHSKRRSSTRSGGFPGERELPGPAARCDGGGLVVSNAAISTSLGRSLAACGTRVPCTSTVTVDVVLPNTYFQEPRLHQLDLRFSRTFQLPRGGSIDRSSTSSMRRIRTRY